MTIEPIFACFYNSGHKGLTVFKCEKNILTANEVRKRFWVSMVTLTNAGAGRGEQSPSVIHSLEGGTAHPPSNMLCTVCSKSLFHHIYVSTFNRQDEVYYIQLQVTILFHLSIKYISTNISLVNVLFYVVWHFLTDLPR